MKKQQNTFGFTEIEYVWFYRNRKGFVFADSLYEAKRKVCSEQKIRKSQQSLVSIMPKDSYEKGHFIYD